MKNFEIPDYLTTTERKFLILYSHWIGHTIEEDDKPCNTCDYFSIILQLTDKTYNINKEMLEK